jgi:WD40 repeat protein/serine/threonine protein kinase
MAVSPCVTETDLRNYQLGKLPEPIVAIVERHLQECQSCTASLAELDDVSDPFVRILRPPGVDNGWTGPWTSQTPVAPAVPAPESEAVSVPGYQVLRELGRGGMSVVYLARQDSPERLVALKMILAGPHADAERRLRVRAEADAIARLQHPNIVTIYEIGEHAGLPFLALEYVRGGSLRDHVSGKPQPPADAAALVETLSRAMHYAHQRGVVHRDLKPANVLLQEDLTQRRKDAKEDSQEENQSHQDPSSRFPSSGLCVFASLREVLPKITDFGLAKHDRAALTMTGAVLGTPSYMAPEQALGHTAAVGPATDIYALGAILYELLTGRPPFQGVSVLETLEQVRTGEPPSPRLLQPGVPRDLETVCLKCLEKDPKKRYEDAAGLAEDLRRFQAGEPVLARPMGALGRLLKWVRRYPTVAALSSAVTLVTVVGVVFVLWALGKALHEKDVAHGEALRADGEAGKARQAAQRAEEKTAEAKREAEAARKARDLADLKAYHAELRLADAFLRAREPRSALQALERVPTAYRDWGYHYLHRRAEGTPLRLRHAAPVRKVMYSPAGDRLVTLSSDSSVKVWDTSTGTLVRALPQQHLGVACVAFSPNGAHVAIAPANTIQVWDITSGNLVLTLTGHTSQVFSVAYSPDGSRIASASADRTVKVWDLPRGTAILTLRGHTQLVYTAAYSPDGSRIASTAADDTAKVWDARSGRLLFTIPNISMVGHSLVFSPDGSRIAITQGTEVTIWGSTDGRQLGKVRAQPAAIRCLAYSPDGRHIATGTADAAVRVWNAETGYLVGALLGHTGTINAVAYAPDGNRIATASEDATLEIWEPPGHGDAGILWMPRGGVWSASFSPDGRHLAAWCQDVTATVLDARSGLEVLTFTGSSPLNCLSYGPDSSRIVTGNGRGGIQVWGARSGAELASWSGHDGKVWAVAFSPDGSRIVSGSEDRTVKVWDSTSGALVHVLRGHTDRVRAVACARDGRQTVSASDDGTIKLWDAARGTEVRTLRGPGRRLLAVAFAPDGSHIVGGSEDQTALVWDAGSGDLVLTLRGHTGAVTSVAYSPDSSRIASGSFDNSVNLWDARDGTLVLSLRGHSSGVNSVAYSSDGSRIVSAAYDNTVRVRDARSSKFLEDPSSAPRTWTAYDPWAEDRHRGAALAPLWHAEALRAAAAERDTNAMDFHRRRLQTGDNLRRLAWARLAWARLPSGNVPVFQDGLEQLRQQQRAYGALARPWLTTATTAFALAAQPTLALGSGPSATLALVHQEEARYAALLVHTAALVPDSPVSATELVQLGQQCVAADPRSAHYRELLGAALYRAGKPEEAVRELTESMRLSGKDGSLWARLFMALSQQRLGHPRAADEWQEKADAAGPWDEQVLQAQLLHELAKARAGPRP